MNLYVKLFLYGGISFGILMGIGIGLLDGPSAGVSLGIVYGLLGGLGLSLVLGTTHKLSTMRMSSKNGVGVEPCQKNSSVIDDSLESVFDRCIQALDLMRARTVDIDKENGRITAKMSMSWRSFGETLEVRLLEVGGANTEVAISSSPILKTTLVDYGKGRLNVTSFIDLLNTCNSEISQ